MHIHWKLEIYDASGTVIASARRFPDNAPTIHGDMIAMAETLPAVTSLTRFLTDPAPPAAAAYTAYAEACQQTYGQNLPAWEELQNRPDKQHLTAIWAAVARAAAAVDPSLN